MNRLDCIHTIQFDPIRLDEEVAINCNVIITATQHTNMGKLKYQILQGFTNYQFHKFHWDSCNGRFPNNIMVEFKKSQKGSVVVKLA